MAAPTADAARLRHVVDLVVRARRSRVRPAPVTAEWTMSDRGVIEAVSADEAEGASER
ncbi:hypothetical protein [Saccharothrix obliqua]|uniref:hypothetical protein n=1 Tax=Saccharothrix obliqua TaxID=2861747 RepID=UPI001C5FD519|nr:hypothetical protein [Saccharothrix obliqua]MBW4720280.1 hypothetical protein [Saccharothrix obliqua]